MGYVYRYRDNTDGIIKYVGIVYGNTRTLEMRCNEHLLNDEWCNTNFTIEYITEDIDNRSEAECFESHYISLYGTDKYFNKTKLGWGINKYLPDREKDFLVYSLPFDNVEIKKIYEVWHSYVAQINVYESEDCYKYVDKRRKGVIAKKDIEKHCGSRLYTFDKEKAYLHIKKNVLQSIKQHEDSINKLNKQLKDINAVLQNIELKTQN